MESVPIHCIKLMYRTHVAVLTPSHRSMTTSMVSSCRDSTCLFGRLCSRWAQSLGFDMATCPRVFAMQMPTIALVSSAASAPGTAAAAPGCPDSSAATAPVASVVPPALVPGLTSTMSPGVTSSRAAPITMGSTSSAAPAPVSFLLAQVLVTSWLAGGSFRIADWGSMATCSRSWTALCEDVLCDATWLRGYALRRHVRQYVAELADLSERSFDSGRHWHSF